MARDKLYHVLAGAGITLLLYPVIGFAAMLAAIVVGLLKEYLFDVIRLEGYPDVWDAVSTAIGALAAGGAVLLAKLLSAGS